MELKTAKDFIADKWSNPSYSPSINSVSKWLEEYANQVIDKCAERVEFDNTHYNGSNKQSILNVKKLIK